MSTYAQCKIYGGWDIENCPLPSTYDAGNVARDIKTFLERHGFFGELELHAVAGHKKRVPLEIQNKLNDLECGVNFYHLFNNRKPDACDGEIMDQIELWATKNPAPAVLMVITGDHGFADRLKHLKEKNYLIVVVSRRDGVANDLKEISPYIWAWEDMVHV